MENIYIPIARIRPFSVTTYAIPTVRPRRTPAQEDTAKNLTRGVFKGVISEKARRNLKMIAEGWLLSIQEAKKAGKVQSDKKKNYITFVTLTLSSVQKHTDNQIKRDLLNNFIISVQRQFGVQEYIWRAESQKNGNIHFHLFLDKYIHWYFLRQTWNKLQEKLGYITEFTRLHGHKNANSTDIERIRTVTGATNYITKYIAKESENRTIQGRVWGCSDNLRKVSAYETQIDSEIFSLLNELKNEKSIRFVNGEHYTVLIGDIRKILIQSYKSLAEEIRLHYENIYSTLYP